MEEDRDPMIPGHTVEQYRKRVVEDSERYRRENSQIRYIIGEAFRKSHCSVRINKSTPVLVAFQDPFRGEVFGTYYLIVDPDRFYEGGLVTKTIKNPERIWESLREYQENKRIRKKSKKHRRKNCGFTKK